MSKILRNCDYCGKQFVTWTGRLDRGSGKYCSRPCTENGKRTNGVYERLANEQRGIKQGHMAQRKRGEFRQCEICNQTFYIQPNQIRDDQGKYCSRKCYFEAIKAGKYGVKKGRKTGMYRNCPKCGKQFWVRPSQLAKFHNCCSLECANEIRKKGEMHRCVICGKEFYLCPSRRAEGRRFCSHTCAQKENNNKRWRDGVYDGVFRSPTTIEISMANALRKLKIYYKQEWRPESYTRIFDFKVDPNILIEVQGDYWHSIDRAKIRDLEKANWAKTNGYQLVEVWEHEIHEIGAIELVKSRVLPLIGEIQ